MDREEIRTTLLALFNEETGQSLTVFSDNVHFVADLGLDSVDTVSLVMQVERHYRIRMTHEELTDALTVGSMLELIMSKLVKSAESQAIAPALKSAA